MVTTSTLKQEAVTAALPDDDVMLERRGFQTRGLRRELGPDVMPVNGIGNDTRKVEAGNASFVDEDSDLPLGPTGIGETGGSVGLTEERGSEFDLFRYAHHMRVLEEDEEVDAAQVAEKTRAMMELFDLKMDHTVFSGVSDENGNTLRNDIFSELKSNIPSSRTIDCSTLSLANDLNGVEANVFREEAYAQMEGHYFQDQWAVGIAKHPVWARLNALDTADGAAIFTHWEVSGGERVAGTPGLINRRFRVPSYLGLPSSSANAGDLSFNISSLGSDEMLLLPPTNGDFMQLWEQGTPDSRGPIQKSGWAHEFEYKMWGGHAFASDFAAGGDAPQDDNGNPYPDCIHVTNLSSLF